MKKIILLTTPLALFAMSAYAANYNATLGEGTYNWTDEIWDVAPNNAGTVSVTGEGADKSILNYSELSYVSLFCIRIYFIILFKTSLP